MKHVLLDIEALGLRLGGAVIELAAVAFDLDSGQTGAEFLRAIKPVAPFTVDLDTLAWHRKHGSVIDKHDAVQPREAILAFLDWLDTVFGKVPETRKAVTFWSWGTTYDFPILEPLLDLRNPEDPHPWRYFQVRDARTVWQLAFGDHRHDPRPHDALQDCRMAVADLVDAYRELTAGRDVMRGTGIGLIAAERARQISGEGWTAANDDRYDIGQLTDGAICYATAGTCLANGKVMMGDDYDCTPENLVPNFKEHGFGVGVSWPWDWNWLKISPDPIRNYAKAGALIAAEIDRLHRRAAKEGSAT